MTDHQPTPFMVRICRIKPKNGNSNLKQKRKNLVLLKEIQIKLNGRKLQHRKLIGVLQMKRLEWEKHSK